MVMSGMTLLRKKGKPDKSRQDTSLVGLEKTTELVTSGIYGYIRHPLYSSLLLLAWGVFFKVPDLLGMGLVLSATVLLYVTGRIEEKENISFFGNAYSEYMQKTKMFIPFVF
jgi:protein-S-isoprenylcysteine O-methyltransferase Ste14